MTMKRREFLASPALAAIIPSSIGRFAAEPDPANDGTLPSQLNWQQFRQRLHQDFETYAPGVEYFMFGNGDIQAILQYMPDRSGDRPMTFAGLTLMDAERFARKWSTFLFHPERGFDRSMVTVALDGKNHSAAPETFRSIGWTYPAKIPTVSLEWTAGPCTVREDFWVPFEGKTLFRRVLLTNASSAPFDPTLLIALVPSFALFDEIGPSGKSILAKGFAHLKLSALDAHVKSAGRYDLIINPGPVLPGTSREIILVYQADTSPPKMSRTKYDALAAATSRFWGSKHSVTTGDPMLDHLYAVARSGLKGMLGRSGKRDSGIWMYNMEWVRDDMMMMLGLLHAGFDDEARTILLKTLDRSVGPDGCTIESSRWSGYDLTELDQNGELLYGVWCYLCWTGDRALIRKYWKKIALVADYPLQPVFWDTASGLLRNKREYWERGGEGFGIEDGFELTYQFWMALGLEKAAQIARMLKQPAAEKRWTDAAAKIRYGMFEHPKFRMVENGALIKRRTRDGRWQQYMIPANRAALPPGSPLATVEKPESDPDTASALPVVFEMVDPKGPLAAATLESIERLWNQQWTHGGYSRYNTTSEPDPPAPWPFATLFMARAYAEAGNDEKVWRALRWLNDIHGGKAGAWFERYGPSITPPAPPVSVVGWTWAEISLLFIHHFAGFRPEMDRLVIRPKPVKGISTLRTTQTVRGADVELIVHTGTSTPGATVNGKPVAMKEGKIELPYPKKGSTTKISINL